MRRAVVPTKYWHRLDDGRVQCDVPPTPPATLSRRSALKAGVRYAYTGNVQDTEGSSTFCHVCAAELIGRDGYALTDWNLDDRGRCPSCREPCPGLFQASPGTWGERRLPVRLKDFAA